MQGFESISETIAYIDSFTWSERRQGLDRMRALMAQLGDPQKKLKFIHVTGTNGKGSTCAMLAEIMTRAGYRTGLYTSPHIEEFRERIRLNGQMITEEELMRHTAIVSEAVARAEERPSQFELTTAIGLNYFLEQNCDIVVLEVGMGGRYDCTNVIDAPEAAVICNIGLEHTRFLGNTLAAITEQKCGIIKPGTAVACYENSDEIMEIVRRTCEEQQVPLYPAEAETAAYPMGLQGRFQIRNARTALAAVRALRNKGWKIPEKAVKEGLANVRWPARFEVMERDPLFILDGGHNAQCAEAIAETLTELLPGRKVTFLTGMLRDKDIEQITEILRPHAAEFVCITPGSDRAFPAEELAKYFRDRGIDAQAAKNTEDGIRLAKTLGRPVVAWGSLYAAGEVRSLMKDVIG